MYENSSLKYILHDEGRIAVNGSSAIYEYHLKDHLGNTRVAFQENQSDPVQSTDYYPFGLSMNMSQLSDNKYLYNGKELQEQTDWLDYGARMYDVSIARFHTKDPLAETFGYQSIYVYAGNNPILCIDLYGLGPIKYLKKEPYIGDHDYRTAVHNTFVSAWNQIAGLAEFIEIAIENPNIIPEGHEILWNIDHGLQDFFENSRWEEVSLREDIAGGVVLGAISKLGLNKLKFKQKIKFDPYDDVAFRIKKAQYRPSYRKGVVEEVWERAKDVDGNVYDPNTGELLTWDKFKSRFDQWHMGHTPGNEWAKLKQRYIEGGITWQELLDEYNNIDNYAPESPISNMSHKFEAK